MTESFLETRLALFRLLQAAYAGPITLDLAEALLEAAAAYNEGVERAIPPLALPDPGLDLHEYYRLFVGPAVLVAPPYESVYRSPEQALMQAETLAVRAFYQAHGLTLRTEMSEPDDHLAFELEFYAYLQEQRLDRAQALFWERHLRQWVPAFCRRVIDGSRSPFYRSLAAVTREVVIAEQQILATWVTKEENVYEGSR